MGAMLLSCSASALFAKVFLCQTGRTLHRGRESAGKSRCHPLGSLNGSPWWWVESRRGTSFATTQTCTSAPALPQAWTNGLTRVPNLTEPSSCVKWGLSFKVVVWSRDNAFEVPGLLHRTNSSSDLGHGTLSPFTLTTREFL